MKPKYNVKGSTDENYNMFTQKPDSNTKNSLLFTIRPSNYRTMVRRDLRLRGDLIYPIRVRDGTERPAGAPQNPLLNPQNFSFRDRPLNRMLSEPTLTVNGEKMVVQLEDIFQSVNMLTFDDGQSNTLTTPNNLDLTYANYSKAIGSQSTPLNSLMSASLQTQHMADGSFPISFTDENGVDLAGNGHYNGDNGNDVYYINGIPVNSQGTAGPPANPIPVGYEYDLYVKIRINENIMISPLLYYGNGLETESFWGIKDLQLRLNFQTQMNIVRNAFSAGGKTVIENANRGRNITHYFKNPDLVYYQLDPPTEIADQIPPLNILPLVDHQTRRATQAGQVQTIQRGSQMKLNSDNIRLSSVPEKLILITRLPRSSMTPVDADFHYVPVKLSIRLGNQTGILNTFDQVALYNSVRKYIPISWQSFSGKSSGGNTGDTQVATVSAPIILDFGTDIPLPAGFSPGVSSNFNIEVSMEIENQLIPEGGNTSDGVEMILDFVTSGFLYNENGTSQSFFGFLTPTDVFNTPVDHSEQELDPPIGGNFFKTLGHSASTLGKHASKPAKSVGKHVAKQASNRAMDYVMSNLA
jgi:hypothetical protein